MFIRIYFQTSKVKRPSFVLYYSHWLKSFIDDTRDRQCEFHFPLSDACQATGAKKKVVCFERVYYAYWMELIKKIEIGIRVSYTDTENVYYEINRVANVRSKSFLKIFKYIL